ncbi:MAG TPA: ComEC/Rec2 family competence protein [Solirubrobacterales bacterium]
MQARRSLVPLLCAALAAALALSHTTEVRARAEAALESGMPEREAALARGFVLGQDEAIDAGTVEDFRRSGLAHLLAVSGQNVALLALLAMPLLAALGMPLRTRLLWVLGLIAVYVPLAGAGPSILRAGIMGGLSVWATLAGRRSSRLYALVVAAAVTLAIDPTLAADVGWQLSFAAVLGIVLLAAPLRGAIVGWLGAGAWRRALAEAAAMTISATLITAPLVAFHFESVSTTTLAANLLALPAVAPAMWLGMLVVAAGQVPGFPVDALNAVNALLLAYIAQVAAWCGRPDWAYLEVRLGLGGLVGCYLAIATLSILVLRVGRSRRLAARRRRDPAGVRLLPAKARYLVLGIVVVLAALVLLRPVAGGPAASLPVVSLRVTVLDVGQGDAILLQPRGAPALLVDSGPPGEEIAAQLEEAGVERLGAVVVTHDQSDHAGGLAEVLSSLPVDRLLFGAIERRTSAFAGAAGIPTRRLARGDALRSGDLSLEVLWPPVELLDGPLVGEDPNRLSLVLLVRLHRFSMLLTGDAEAESVPLDPGPVDVLKVAHHGSDDAGLAALLDRTRPRLAVISVGEGNSFGHPTPTTLATLAEHGVRMLRTDRDSAIVLDVGSRSVHVSGAG